MIPRQQPAAPREEAFEVLAFHNWDALEAVRNVLAERDAVEEWLRVGNRDGARFYARLEALTLTWNIQRSLRSACAGLRTAT